MSVKPIKLAKLRRSCSTCHLRTLCLPRSLDRDAMNALDALVGSRVLRERDHLYRRGQASHSLYVVRSGSVEVHIEAPSGDEQVIGFYLPGDLVGLDALADAQHSTTCVALETSNLCTLPYSRLEALCSRTPKLNRQLDSLLARELCSEQQLLLSLGRRGLEQRLAVFLLDLSRRWGTLGYSSARFRLTMTRGQIASYLGSAPESVSRAFSRLREAGVVRLQGRDIHLLDMARLVELSVAPGPFRHVQPAS